MMKYFREGIPKISYHRYSANKARYIMRVPGDTVGLILYYSNGEIIVENNPGLTEKQVKNKIDIFLEIINGGPTYNDL